MTGSPRDLAELLRLDVVPPHQPVEALAHHAGGARGLAHAALMALHEGEQILPRRPEAYEVDVLVIRQLGQRRERA